MEPRGCQTRGRATHERPLVIRQSQQRCSEWGSMHPGGFDASMADGSVWFFQDSVNNPIDQRLLKGLATRNGGEAVAPP